MNTIYRTAQFKNWFAGLKDRALRSRISLHIDRAVMGNFGDHASVGDGVFEMRLHFGPGYRLYYFQAEHTIYYLLAGGDKSTQSQDIARAKKMKKEILEGGEQ